MAMQVSVLGITSSLAALSRLMRMLWKEKVESRNRWSRKVLLKSLVRVQVEVTDGF